MKTTYPAKRLPVILAAMPLLLGACSGEDVPGTEGNGDEIVVKTYKVGTVMESAAGGDITKSASYIEFEGLILYKDEDGGVYVYNQEEAAQAKNLAGEYTSNILHIVGQDASGNWAGLPCTVDRSVTDKVYFSFYLDMATQGGVPKTYTFRNDKNASITIPAENQMYYSSVDDDDISLELSPSWLPTPNGASTYKPILDCNYFRAKDCVLGICPEGNPMIGNDIIYSDRDNYLTTYLERLTAVFGVKVILTNRTDPLAEADWGTVFAGYGDPSDWTIASYLTEFPVSYNIKDKTFGARGIVGLHDTTRPSFARKTVLVYVDDDNIGYETTYVAASDMKPRVFYYNDDRAPRVQIVFYYKYGQADEQMRVASIPVPRFNSNQNWTLNLYVDAADMLATPPVARGAVSKSFAEEAAFVQAKTVWEVEN